MAFNPDYLSNLADVGKTWTSTKAKGKRRKQPFRLNKRKRFDPSLTIPRSQLPKKYRSTTYAEILHPDRRAAMEDDPQLGNKATTARGNDGMSFVW